MSNTIRRTFNETVVKAVWYDKQGNPVMCEETMTCPSITVAAARRVLRKRGHEVPSTAELFIKPIGSVTYECLLSVFIEHARVGHVLGGVNRTVKPCNFKLASLGFDEEGNVIERVYAEFTADDMSDADAKAYGRKLTGRDIPSTCRVFKTSDDANAVEYGMTAEEFKTISHIVETFTA